jgi:hypothetical protein
MYYNITFDIPKNVECVAEYNKIFTLTVIYIYIYIYIYITIDFSKHSSMNSIKIIVFLHNF